MRLFSIQTIAIFIFSSFLSQKAFTQNNPNNRQLVLQGFWWDYWNNNYPNDWANYLTELAPRLKSLGIDAVWIPPSIKNTGTNSVGYAPFDHYDLGDKYQKNAANTRLGDKDELLRMVAVMKANGIDVIQDIVLNHITGAGSAAGQGGNDPAAMDDGQTNKYKNFRYSCYATPALNETSSNYLSREGRFPKNWQNFYPNPGNPCCSNEINSPYWGPDISFESNGFGQSSNALYNPTQSADYMRNGMRNWLIWYKKQMGWDGVRLDAVKHFPVYAAEDFLWNLQFGSLWASGGWDMFAVGEWIGGSSELDGWANAVQNRAGTFDFSLRNALTGIVSGNGGFDLSTVPSYQQSNRDRTMPFVNNHDTYRPILDAQGNYTGWNTANQIGSQIEPNDVRRSVAYAISFAVDGAPLIYFEDLFNIGYNSNRFNHNPTNSTELPFFSDLENLIWCHQNLHFKDGAYFVRWQAADALVIEREAKALIAVNDSWSSWQNLSNVQTSWPDGTELKDYSGANGTATVTVSNGGKVSISIPPCDGSAGAGRRGYCIWAPIGISENYVLPSNRITQEWEMADDLGDNHPLSLQQGGRLPDNSQDCRVVGKIYVESGQQVNLELYPENPALPITIQYLDADCEILDSVSDSGTILDSIVPNYSGWLTLRIKNATSSQMGQKCWVKLNYKAPEIVNTSGAKNKCACETSSSTIYENELIKQMTVYPNPSNEFIQLVIPNEENTICTVKVLNAEGKIVQIKEHFIPVDNKIDIRSLAEGWYHLELHGEKGTYHSFFIKE
jgi:alpha-amylase